MSAGAALAAVASGPGIPVSTAGGGFGFPILPAIVVLPAIGALVCALVPRRRDDLARLIGTVVAVAVAGLAIAMAVRFRAGQPGYQFVVANQWIPSFGIQWKLGVDGISVFIVAVTAVLFPVAIAAPRVEADQKGYTAWMLLLETACLGALLSLDVFLFFVFFELTLPPMYMLIGRWGGPRRAAAALKFFVYTFAGSALMLIALIALAVLHQRATGQLTFDLITLTTQQHFSSGVGLALFLGFAAAFAVKVPIFPFHTWLPDAQVEASTGGSMVLAGVMFSLGTYGLVRFCIELFPHAAVTLAPVMLTLGAIGVVYGFLVAVVQTDLKRMIAYTLVADLGVIVVGLFAFTSQGISGGVYQTVNHGVSMGAMFLLIGLLIERLGTAELPNMGGVQKRAPVMAAVFLVVTLSVVGVPGLNGFVGEFLLLLGSFLTRRWWAVVATTGVILAALVFLWAYQQAFHGRPRTGRTMPDLSRRDLIAVIPLVALVVGLGVYPTPFLDRINPSANRVLHAVTSQTNVAPPSVASP
ncbi:MAG TPA: NADH-quinone oxidoreductase subunit M [Acidimicrobiales bacterium]|nr:NADH-quinone oxidoreductase subunit M [Acidimicrobiales bacterium]